MDELDNIARRSSDTVNAQAADVARTEDSLREVHADSAGAAVPMASRSRRWLTIGVAAAVVAALVVGGVVLANRDNQHSIVNSNPSVVVTEPSATLPGTVPDTVEPEPTTTTSVESTTTTSTADGAPTNRLDPAIDHGLSSSMSADFLGVRRHDYLLPEATDRADYLLTIYLPSGAKLRVNLGHDSTQYTNRQPVTIGGDEGWQAPGDQYSDVAYAVGRRLNDSTWLRVEAVREEGDTALVVPSADDMLALAGVFEYDPTVDDRVSILTTDAPFVQPQPCANEVSVTGGGPDMVLFLCDGRLGVFSGETGEMIELIQQFDDQRGPGPSEGPGVPYVDGIAVAPDNTTVYFSVGPEPAVGSTYKYVIGSGVPPEMVSYGHSPAVSSDGSRVATIALDDILIVEPDAPEHNRTLTGIPINPQSRPSWSPDDTQIAFEVGRGVIAVAPVTGEHDGETQLYASDEPGRWFVEPWLTADGLLAGSFCCNDPSGQVSLVKVGPAGNHPVTVVNDTRPLDGDPTDGTIGLGGVWATGVIAWAPIN